MIDVTRPAKPKRATGSPGTKPTWSSGAKTLVGTAASPRSHVWYTVGLGTLNEIYFGDVEQANTKSIRFLIADSAGFFSDEAVDAHHEVTSDAGIPWCRIESTCKTGRYRIVKEVIADPVHDSVVVRVQFTQLKGAGLKLYLFVDPHIGDQGAGNSAWAGRYKGRPVLIASRGAIALAVALTAPVTQSSCGFIGKTDGYTLLSKRKALTDRNVAVRGNVAMTAEVEWTAMEAGKFVFAAAFGTTPPEAAQEATAGILQDFGRSKDLFVSGWEKEQAGYAEMKDLSGHPLDMYRVSTAVLETHQSKRFAGGFIASLSLPWGFHCSDKDIGGYHVLWPRDMVETAMGKLACGDTGSARATLFYLRCTQEETGGWSQNMFLDGTPHWSAVQMDGTAMPILLADQLRRENALDGYDVTPMVDAAARFLLKHGPYTMQDRWEALPGYSPYTTATEVAALLAVADLIEMAGNDAGAVFIRETADAWHDTVDEFTYVTDTALSKAHDVSGYYIRMAPPERVRKPDIGGLFHVMHDLAPGHKRQRAIDIVSPDAIALVRFGLRSPSDPRVLNTIKILDATLKRETKTGPVWMRSSKDGYGEQKDGGPYKTTGIGRGWPLLAGERAHYELAAGNREFALELLKTMSRQTSACGMIPEQVWESRDLPRHLLFNGRPSGSAMPLVWAHSEYIKLLRSLHAGTVWDLPPQPVQRYQIDKRTAAFQIWTPTQRRGWVSPGKHLRIDLTAPARIRWSADGRSGELMTEDSGFGLHCGTLPTTAIGHAKRIRVQIIPAADAANSKVKAESFVVCQAPFAKQS